MRRRALRFWWVGILGMAGLLILPLSVAAATNAEIIAIMQAVIQGVLDAGAQAYCAAGVVALCP